MSDHTVEATGPAAVGHWTLDPAHSHVSITSKALWGLMPVKGVFTRLSGSGDVAADGTAAGTLTIAAASIDTRNAKRDDHLRGADFFDTAVHPDIVFTAHRLVPGAGGEVRATGTLSVAGVEHPLEFTATAEHAGDTVTLTARTTVDRGDFGLTWNNLGMLVGRTRVTVTARFTRAAA
ncbi:YceI family protein [Actinacidiphila sp. ITFR-21]|uniref:YceI family protein n=1 Tax=Actinacidiphila sp. ITFR-21 TaxID=3075199 RepID=UPI002889C35D|nr:YceI family protein [Streptomyces sp. ITFR-21]WNI14227.1 YceI family protein [Streptomyces sp. ITFR-21]